MGGDGSILDVLIVGAGPTGLTLALELASHSVAYRIVDKAAVRSDKSRALVVHPRTQELMNRHGDVRGLLVARGRSLKGITWFMGPTRTPHFDFDDLDVTDTEFPVPLGVSQAETELFLESALKKKLGGGGGGGGSAGGGGLVEYSVAAEKVVPDEDGETVTVTLSHHGDGDGGQTTETLRCRYVVGCDGAHSVVRHAAAETIQFPGEAYAQDFMLCDARLTGTTIPLDRIAAVLGSSLVGIFPLGGDLVRVAAVRVGSTHPGEDVEPSLSDFQAALDDVVLPTLPPGGRQGTLSDPVWVTRFRLHHRCATSYRSGRLFLAGDAAHIHSPLGGQGMNTSIQDAVNLGWKLAAVLQGKSPPGLLDSYNEERRPVGRALITTTDNIFRAATLTNWLLIKLRTWFLSWVLPLLLRDKSRRRRLFGGIAEFAVNYRGSSIVGAGKGWDGPVRGGDRLPDGELLLLNGGGGGGGGGGGATTTTLQKLCGGMEHRVLLFAGAAEREDAVQADVLVDAAAKVAEARQGISISTIVAAAAADSDAAATAGAAAQTPPLKGALRDPGGTLHGLFGFRRAGYVLARPDGYVGHIGNLSSMDELVAFLKKG